MCAALEMANIRMTYDEALEYIDGLLRFGIKFGLDRISALAEAFGNPQKKLRVIHVGGTNGKGSTATMIASILQEAGYRTGLYLSPYVNDVRERIQINGHMISKDEFAKLVANIQPVVADIAKTELGPATEFEVKTMMAYLHFVQRNVDFAVLEVGMGGRFDATNIVEPLVAVITNVSLDHMERLGNTVEKIAFEKAGIIKTGSIIITAAEHPDAWRVISDKCRETGAEVWRVMNSQAMPQGPSADVQIRYTSENDRVSVCGSEMCIRDLRPGLMGKFQHINAATAVAAILALEKYEIKIPKPAISAGIANAYIPGRMEILQDAPKLIIDGAHNPDAARTLADSIRKDIQYDRLILVVGMLSTHPAKEFLANIAPMASKIIATQSLWMKAAPAQNIADAAREFCNDIEVIDRVTLAVRHALAIASPNDLVLVTGSFYTIGEVQSSPDYRSGNSE